MIYGLASRLCLCSYQIANQRTHASGSQTSNLGTLKSKLYRVSHFNPTGIALTAFHHKFRMYSISFDDVFFGGKVINRKLMQSVPFDKFYRCRNQFFSQEIKLAFIFSIEYSLLFNVRQKKSVDKNVRNSISRFWKYTVVLINKSTLLI